MTQQITQQRKDIILAGGSGTRLCPVTRAVSRQLQALCQGRIGIIDVNGIYPLRLLKEGVQP